MRSGDASLGASAPARSELAESHVQTSDVCSESECILELKRALSSHLSTLSEPSSACSKALDVGERGRVSLRLLYHKRQSWQCSHHGL